MVLPCDAEDATDTRGEMVLSDLKTAPRLWADGLKNLAKPTELMLLGGGVIATGIVWIFKEEMAWEIQRHDNYRDISSIGDHYGTAVNFVIPQLGIYALGVGTKNDKIREFGLLTTHSAIVSGVMIVALKGIINSGRPDGSSRGRFHSSFPSGHALGTAALAGTVHRRYGTLYALPFQLASLYSGLSRVVDNRHRPHEVVASWGIGYATGYAIARAWEKVRPSTGHITLKPWIYPDAEGAAGLSMQLRF